MLALALILVAPVTGPVARDFAPGLPFEAGRHRGVDFAATPGASVRAACAGPVAFAGRIGADGIVTLRCGPWRVTHMPLATISARGRVARGTVIGTAGSSPDHAGLHLGVRRDGTRFGYVDPLGFLAPGTRPVPLGRAPRGRGPRVGPAPRPVRPAPRSVGPGPRPVGPGLRPVGWGARRVGRPPTLVLRPRLVRPPAAASLPLAPWPAWAGLALVLAGAGVSLRVRARVRTRSPARRGGSVAA